VLETIGEKIAYLRGIVDGDSSLEDSRSAFLFSRILQVLEELAREVDELKRGQDELDEYLQEVDFDLAYLEDEFFGDDDDDDYDYYPDEWDDDDEESFAEAQCPQCGHVMRFDEAFLFDEGVQIRCQRCNAVVFETDDFDELEKVFDTETEPDDEE